MKLVISNRGTHAVRFRSGLEIKVVDCLFATVLVFSAFGLSWVSLEVGSTDAGSDELWRILLNQPIEPQRFFAIWNIRLPHLLVAFFAGWCVALSGAILQPIARNPLADPGLFGISHGSVTAIMLLLAFAPLASPILVVSVSVLGGIGAAVLLILLVGNDQSSGFAILLMGIAVATVLGSINSFLILYMPSEISYNLASWLAGSLLNADWSTIFWLLPLFILSLIGIACIGRSLNLYALGHEHAMSLGEPVWISRPLLILFAVILSSSAVTTVGPLLFLGVLAPHLACFVSSATGSIRLLLSGLVGGNLVIAADIFTRSGVVGQSPPLGLSFIIIGVPLFIVALRLNALRLSTTTQRM